MQQNSLIYKALLLGTVPAVALVLGVSCLQPTAAFSETLSKKDTANYRSAFKAAKANQWRQANRFAARAKNPLPAKVVSWLQYSSQNSKAKFGTIDAFLKENPHWPRRFELRRRAEEAMKTALSDDAALVWFGANPPLTATGAARYANALFAKARKPEATAFVRKTWRDLNMTRADTRDFRRQFQKLLRNEDHIDRLDRLIWDQRVGSARRQMRRVGRDYQHLAQARLQLILRIGGVDNAIARVPESLREHPGLVYERLRWRRRKGFSDRAIELLHDPPARMARPKKWWLERAILTRRALRDGDITLAYRLARNHKQTDGAPYAEAEWLAGWIALRFLRDYDVARQHFTQLYDSVRYPISRARGAYWTARAIEANPADIAKRFEKAAAWYGAASKYTTTFYGQLAADRLRQSLKSKPPPEPKPQPKEIRAFENRELVRVTRLLADLGQNKLVKVFVLRLTKMTKRPTEWALIAKLATDIGRNDLVIKAAKLAIRQGVALTVAGYPKLKVTRKFPVEPALMHAVIRQESAFDTKAISRAGARGLMQLMPATAKAVARRLKIQHSKQRLVSDPVHNLRLGSAYLDQLRDTYDGSLILTLAAYNAGPGNVKRWVRLNGDPRDFSTLDAIDWIESIPAPETRNYVQRVLENMTIYGYRFEDRFLPELIVDAMIGSDTVDYP